MDLKIKEVSWHRNGSGGQGFYAVYFTDNQTESQPIEMLGIIFDEPSYCAVVQLDQKPFTVAFGVNSWRGDYYEPDLRKAIKEQQHIGSIRVGPFGIPVTSNTH